ALGSSGMDHPPAARCGHANRITSGGLRRGGPSRFPAGRIVFGDRGGRGGAASCGGAAVDVHPCGERPGARCRVDGRSGGGTGVVFGGGRVRGGQPDHGAVVAPTGVSCRRPGRGCEAVRHAGGHVRPGVRGTLCALHLPGGHGECLCGRPIGVGRPMMNRETENTVLLLVGVSIAMITVSGVFTRYIKPGLLPWLAASAVVLILLALMAIIGDIRPGGPRTSDAAGDHDHEHFHRSRIVWLLVVPVVVLMFVAPPALRPYATTPSVTSMSNDVLNKSFPPLPVGRS